MVAAAAAVVVVCVFGRSRPDLHAVDVHLSRTAVRRGGHIAVVVPHAARHPELAAVVRPAPAPVVVPLLAQALGVERVVLLLVVAVVAPVVAEAVVAAPVPAARPSRRRGEDDDRSAPAAPDAAVSAGRDARHPGDAERDVGKSVDSGTPRGYDAAGCVAVKREATGLHLEIRKLRHVAFVGTGRCAVRAARVVDHEEHLRVRAFREHEEPLPALPRDHLSAVDAEVRRVGGEVERRRAAHPARARRAETQGDVGREVVRRERYAPAVAGWRDGERAARLAVHSPLEQQAVKAPRRGVGRRGRDEVLLPRARALDVERPLPQDVRRPRRPVGGESVEESPRGEHVRRDDVPGEERLVRGGRGHAREDVRVGDVPQERVESQGHGLAVGNAVTGGVREVGIGSEREQLVEEGKPVAVPVPVRGVLRRKRVERKRGEVGRDGVRRPFETAETCTHEDVRHFIDVETGEVVAVGEAARRPDFHLDADGRVRKSVEKHVLPCELERV